MGKFIILFIILIFSNLYLYPQEIKVKIVYNNSIDMYNNKSQIKEINNSVKISDLKTALIKNDHITDKNMIIRIAFFDKGVIGNLNLKASHELTSTKYIEIWKEELTNNSGLLFLFTKEKGESEYLFNKLVSSDQLEDEHLFPEVMEFINSNLSGDIKTIIGNGTKYIAKAITPVWTEEKKTEAAELSVQSKYGANKINTELDFSFFDFKPASEKDTKEKKLVNCMDKPKEVDGAKWYMSNKYIYTSTDNLGITSSIQLYDWNVAVDEDISGMIVLYDNFLYKLLKYIDETNKHNNLQNASTWAWTKDDNGLSINDISSFSNRTTSDRLIMFRNEEYKKKEGEEISILCASYGSTTWCNIFARDLAYSILFPDILSKNNAPWGSHARASILHDKIQNSNEFKPVTFDEAWKYTNAGYIVYLSSYNSSYYAGNLGKIHPGHIATCYPTEPYEDGSFLTAKVVQAGSKSDVLNFGSAWGKAYGVNREHVSANIYLGYILK